MGKKLVDIKKKVDNSRLLFLEYLKSNLDIEVWKLLSSISDYTDVYVFSGVIRNFFLKNNEIRDLDLIVNHNINIEWLLQSLDISYRRNSFGGFKLTINNTSIDLWYLKDTWALKQQETLDFEIHKYIPSTAFFNFSAIVYHLNAKTFYCKNNFLSFLREKKINYVYKPNANYALCLVNSFYYSDKYHLKIANKLRRFLIELYERNLDYSETQLKHFGKIIYDNNEIENRINHLKQETT